MKVPMWCTENEFDVHHDEAEGVVPYPLEFYKFGPAMHALDARIYHALTDQPPPPSEPVPLVYSDADGISEAIKKLLKSHIALKREEIDLRARAPAQRPYAIATPPYSQENVIRGNVISDYYVQGQLDIRESSRDKFKSEPNEIIYYVFETIKETLKIRRGKKNPGFEWNIEGIVAVCVTITFCITCLAQAVGWAIIPDPLVRIVDIMIGFLFGRGSMKVKPLE